VILSRRALNRATLARQHLLARADLPVPAGVEHLVGMQAQAPLAQYVGLWSRLAGFEPAALATEVAERRLVRTWLMRGTVHLVTARDCLAMRPPLEPVLARYAAGPAARRALAGLDARALEDAGRALLGERPRSRTELRAVLAERWPDRDADALALALYGLLPLVQLPPRGVWGAVGPVRLAPADDLLPAAPALTVDALVLRYLAAFGPATANDAQAWCGLTRLREVLDRLRPRLRTFRDGDGRELFDLPDAPRPDPDTPAPPRYLPEYDNVLFSHADRARVIPDGRPVPLPPGVGATTGTVLVDGDLRATWRLRPDALTIEPHPPLSPTEREQVVAEAARLTAFLDLPDRPVRIPS
jgi:hypothetical protein